MADIGEVAVNLARAAVAGGRFEDAGVPDTPAARQLWADIRADIAAMPAGVVPDIPWDYTSRE